MPDSPAQQGNADSQTKASDRHFVCRRCGACCRWPGIIRLTAEDVRQISQFLHLTEEVFLDTMTELSPERTGLILKDDQSSPCRFLGDGNLCLIQDVKPRQCRDFPEKWDVPQEFRRLCQGEWIEEARHA
jgi:hypothetical protein